MASHWRQLPLPEAGGGHIPPLLVSTSFRPDSYTIYLTDLTHIWSESLSRRALFARSHEVNTSIDPTESDQLEIFLDKLKQGVNGARNTTAALSFSSDTGRPTMTLSITVNLPGGLAPLEWPFRLTPAPQTLLTTELTIRLLQEHHSWQEEIAALTELLREKDHVLQKLLDKFEGKGLDIGQVFPQATAKGGRSLDRKRAEEVVKGLQVFDIETFRKSLEDEESLNTAQLVQSIFSSESQETPRSKVSHRVSDVEGNWWAALQGQTLHVFGNDKSTAASSVENSKQKQKQKPKADPVANESSTEDDDFQVQATPPVSGKSNRKTALTADESTDEDDDLDAAPSQRSIQTRDASPKTQSKIQLIGGRKAAQQFSLQDSSSSDDDSKPPSKGKSAVAKERTRKGPSVDVNSTDDHHLAPTPGGEMLGAVNPEEVQSLPAVDVDTTLNEPPSRKAKSLGKIGGKDASRGPSGLKNDDTTQDKPPKHSPKLEMVSRKKVYPPSDDSSTDDDKLDPEPPKRKGRLGTLGGKKSQPPPSSSDEEPATMPIKVKGKLGMLGGKKKEAQQAPSTATDSSDHENVSLELAPHGKKKIGTIGGNSTSGSVEKTKEESPVRERSVKKEETPLPEETAEEKADKKRLQLKRALEEKSKAPAKKKKKF